MQRGHELAAGALALFVAAVLDDLMRGQTSECRGDDDGCRDAPQQREVPVPRSIEPGEDAIGESVRCGLAFERAREFVFEIHDFTPSHSRRAARPRRRWLLTVLSGMSSTAPISEGSRPSW